MAVPSADSATDIPCPSGRAVHPPDRRRTDELVALLRPNTDAASEHPGGPHRFVVARSAHQGSVAVCGQRDGRTLGPQSPSIFAGGADELAALLLGTHRCA